MGSEIGIRDRLCKYDCIIMQDVSFPQTAYAFFRDVAGRGKAETPGIEVRNDNSETLMHNKFSVIDGHMVMVGMGGLSPICTVCIRIRVCACLFYASDPADN